MAIRPDTDPKSASPRSGAPQGELEQYGVWVKAEPQDVIEEVTMPGFSDTSSLPEESFLSEDEEKLLGSFDSEFELPSVSDESGPLPDIEDMPPLEESLLEPEPSQVMEEVEDIPTRRQEIFLEDFESGSSSIHPGVEIDMGSVEGLEGTQEADMARSGAIEDVSSEFLDLAEEPSPEPVTQHDSNSGLDDVTSEFLDMEASSSAPRASEPSVDFEPLDIDLQFDDSSASGDSGPASLEAGFEAVTDFDDFLSVEGEPAPTTAPPARAVSSVPASGDFDDVSAVERELSSTASPPVTEAGPAALSSSKPDLSTEILLKIANELSNIRGELVSLKTQIGDVMRSVEPGPSKPLQAESVESEESGPTGGFFDDEEDETIALTGDELDNILNTADFTEEIAETEQPLDLGSENLALDASSLEDSSLLDETLLPESGDYSAATSPDAMPAIEEVRLGRDDSVDEIGLETIGPDESELSLVVEEGIKPMTSAPEDTSYLESADFGGSLDLEGAPLGDEPLVEPDLSDFDLEAEDVEPRLEIDEELPLVSSVLAPAEELTLGIDADSGYAAEEPAIDAEFLESVAEIEEPNFAEISLHEEASESASTEPSELEEIDVLSDSGLPSSLSPQYPVPEDEDLVLEAEDEKAPAPRPQADRPALKPTPNEATPARPEAKPSNDGDRLKSEIKSVLSYLDKLLDSLPEDKIEEFANSEYFDTYKKLFEELGLV